MGWLDFKAKATTSADWAVAIEIIDNSTNDPFDASDLEFVLEVSDCGAALLRATTADGTITRPSLSQIAWRFSAAQMRQLAPSTTYAVGCIYTDSEGAVGQFLVGELAIVDGNVSS